MFGSAASNTINSACGDMKARTLPGWVLGIMLAGGVGTIGIAQESASPSPPTVSSDKTGAAAPSPAVPGGAADKSSASSLQLSTWVLEVQRLAQAQVDEGVILAYVTNSPGLFKVTADQIIHLKNVGVSPQVISAMIHRDGELLAGARPELAADMPPPVPDISSPAPAEPQVVATAESWVNESLGPEDDYYAPEQPASAGPVRAPYPVKLNDPIVILKLPSFVVPYW
jgi:hypothetical protein